MIVNWEKLQAAAIGYTALFREFYAKLEPQYPKIAMVTQSSGPEEKYDWLGNVPKMREWLGDRLTKQLTAYDYTIKNKTWEATIGIAREHFEDDKLGLMTPRVQELAYESARHLDELVFTLLGNGFTSTCYDGKYFFATDHSEGSSGTQSNKGTTALSASSYAAARAAMMAIKDDQGKPMGIIPDTLVVPPQLEGTARQILNADYIASTAGTATETNIWKGSADLVVSPYLTDANDWALLCTKRPIKPLIAQIRREAEFNALIDPKSPNVFLSKEFLFGVDDRKNAGYGLWQLAYGSQVA